LKDYLDRFGARGEVTVGPGAWNTGWHNGRDFVQWTGSHRRRRTRLTRVDEISQAVQSARRNAAHLGSGNPELLALAGRGALAGVTGGNQLQLFLGRCLVMRCHADLDQACECLERANARFR
jgi:hypothetical protein